MRNPVGHVSMAAAVAMLFATQIICAQPAARWLFLVDDLHIDFVNTGRMRDLLRQTANQLIRPGEAFALLCTGPSPTSMEWTSDRPALDAAIRSLTGNGLKFRDRIAIAAGTQPQDGRESAAVAKVISILDGLDPSAGSVGMVYFSNGYQELPESLHDAAERTRVPIFAIDPRLTSGNPGALEPPEQWDAYWTATRQSLRALAEVSGGVLLESRWELREAAARFAGLVRQ